MKPYFLAALAGLATLLSSCTDATMSKLSAIGSAHRVQCFSGGKVIYDGITTGRIQNEEHSDGYYFEDSQTRKLVQVNGDCLITVE
jgi:hypothetical protein